ncbi:hypothetical protein BRC77_04680 [Halobacteriales archaeon QH_8_64_26]|nr:MAG: hypothetical protein BRC77_04680 [Halobacteriales archaeon QH_8_64_26]
MPLPRNASVAGRRFSIRAIEKHIEHHGGRREGLFRNDIVYRDGTVVDEVRYTVSQAEYREAIAEPS